MTDQLARLRELARKATPGPWYDAGCWTVHGSDHNEIAHPTNFGDIAYIAALYPSVVLRLLDCIAAADKRRHSQHHDCAPCPGNCEACCADMEYDAARAALGKEGA